MRIGLLGKKVGMAQIFDDAGSQIPVSIVEVGPCYVTAIRSQEQDGYTAVQLGFDEGKIKSFNRAELGHFKKANVKPQRFVEEIRTESTEGLQVGATLHADNFQEGDFVDVIGVSIGKGFQGVVKRHGFSGGEASHGAKFGREAGSTGQSAYPSRVIKGVSMAGQMGNEKVTVQNLKIVKVDVENNLLLIKGAVPGVERGYLVVKSSLKRGKKEAWKIVQKETSKEKKGAEKDPQEKPAEEQAKEKQSESTSPKK